MWLGGFDVNTMLEIINIEKVSSFVGSGKMQR